MPIASISRSRTFSSMNSEARRSVTAFTTSGSDPVYDTLNASPPRTVSTLIAARIPSTIASIGLMRR